MINEFALGGKISQRISKIKSFINRYDWKRINYSSRKDDWKKFKKNNPTIFLNMLYVKKMEIHPSYFLKHNLTPVKEITVLMILQ